ncbi:hypothetical protein CHS0354_012247 [Potamilus streckersoni]|uniref:C2H2-type domain-containing protein n=1 Tax=Potamilus streckersoni TaxID=2493646 RepID=A0AAE0SA81_9BIVA|nr:hypothetical protein CHS0354_012247 [Potamilus streckersoni]
MDERKKRTMWPEDPQPVLTDKDAVLRTDEAIDLLFSTPAEKAVKDLPMYPKGGTVYVFKPRSEGCRDDWQNDGYTWRNHGSSTLPRKDPKLKKKYFYAVMETGDMNFEFRKDVYMHLDAAEKEHGYTTLVHYIGDDGFDDVELKADNQANQSKDSKTEQEKLEDLEIRSENEEKKAKKIDESPNELVIVTETVVGLDAESGLMVTMETTREEVVQIEDVEGYAEEELEKGKVTIAKETSKDANVTVTTEVKEKCLDPETLTDKNKDTISGDKVTEKEIMDKEKPGSSQLEKVAKEGEQTGENKEEIAKEGEQTGENKEEKKQSIEKFNKMIESMCKDIDPEDMDFLFVVTDKKTGKKIHLGSLELSKARLAKQQAAKKSDGEEEEEEESAIPDQDGDGEQGGGKIQSSTARTTRGKRKAVEDGETTSKEDGDNRPKRGRPSLVPGKRPRMGKEDENSSSSSTPASGKYSRKGRDGDNAPKTVSSESEKMTPKLGRGQRKLGKAQDGSKVEEKTKDEDAVKSERASEEEEKEKENTAEKDSSVAQGSPKQGRGRPRIYEKVKKSDDTPKRGRGRPRKVDKEDDSGTAEKETLSIDTEKESDDTPKRGRGRPKKIEKEAEPGLSEKNKTPKGRGRPRKDQSSVSVESVERKTPAGRGRPRKRVLVHDSDSDFESEEEKDEAVTQKGYKRDTSFRTPIGSSFSPAASSDRRTNRGNVYKYQCEVCERSFHIEYLLEQHMKSHPAENAQRKYLAKKKQLDEITPRRNTPGRPPKRLRDSEDEREEKEAKKPKYSPEKVKAKVGRKPKAEVKKEEPVEVEEVIEIHSRSGRKIKLKKEVLAKEIEDEEEEEEYDDDRDENYEASEDEEDEEDKSGRNENKEEESKNNSEKKSHRIKKRFGETRTKRRRSQNSNMPKLEPDEKPICQICGKEFIRPLTLQRHLLLHYGEEYDCPYCDRFFRRKDYLKEHVKRRHKNVDLKDMPIYIRGKDEKPKVDILVDQGDGEESSQDGEDESPDTPKPKRKHQCLECGRIFNFHVTLMTHIRKKHWTSTSEVIGRSIICNICKKRFNSQLALTHHQRIHKPQNRKHRCKYCNEAFTSRDRLRRHIKSEHAYVDTLMYYSYKKVENQVVCEICDKEFDDMEVYLDHRLDHLIFQCQCRNCGHGFSSEEELNKHQESKCQEVDRYLQCGLCELRFISYDTRRKHLKSAHPNMGEFHCVRCGQKFESKKEVGFHVDYHEAEKIFKCETCDRRFMEKRNLISHRTLHLGSRTHGCTVCKRKYFSKKSLYRHMRLHTSEKNYACITCGKRFMYSDDLAKHVKIHITDENGLPVREHLCTICGKGFSLKNRLTRHMQTHESERNFACDICGKRYQTSSSLRSHRIFKHMPENADLYPLKKLICEVCGYMTYVKNRLKRHMQTHLPSRQFECEYCHKMFQTSSSLGTHKMRHMPPKRNSKGELVLYKCTWDNCKKTYTKKATIKRHILAHVWKMKRGKAFCNCSDCRESRRQKIVPAKIDGEVVLSEENVEKLISGSQQVDESVVITDDITLAEVNPNVSVDEKSTETDDLDGVEGDETNVSTQTEEGGEEQKENQIKYITLENQKLPYFCPRCDEEYETACKLVEHMDVHSDDSIFTCDICGSSYMEKRTLQEHMSIHSGDRPFMCTDCGKSFRTKTCYRQHAFIHAKIKPYICSYCGHGFTQKGYFNEHLRRHTGEKPFGCKFCGKRFVSKELLRRHMYVHTGNKPHLCTDCGKSFVERQHLAAHIRTHKNERPFQCNVCPKAFYTNSKLQRHLNSVHSVIRGKTVQFIGPKDGQVTGWKKTRIIGKEFKSSVIYVNSHGQVIQTFTNPEDIKQEADDSDEEEESESIEIPSGAIEVHTRRDSTGHIQVFAQPFEEGSTQTVQMSNASTDTDGQEVYTQEIVAGTTQILQSNSVYSNTISESEVQTVTDVIKQALAEAGQGDGTGHIEVITQEVSGGHIHTDSEGNIQILAHSGDGTEIGENFSINIGEDGTVDLAELEKIEALRNLYQSATSDQPIVIVLESQHSE